MQVSHAGVALLALALLSSCVDSGDEDPNSIAASSPKTTYHCPDGSVIDAWYPSRDTARVSHRGRSIEMAAAVSASGARYVGESWQWWTKGLKEGTITPLSEGEDIASATGITCTAR